MRGFIRIFPLIGKKYLWLFGLMSLFIMVGAVVSADDHFNRPYHAVPGLIDIRSTFSDGVHTIEELVQMARSRGFRVLFINDHDHISLSYGIYPFRNVLRYKKTFPSIKTHGPEQFLAEIRRVSEKYPDMIIIPGCETAPFYYWSGSWTKKNLTVHDIDRKLLIINFTRPDDYKYIPNIGNTLSLRYTKKLLPGVAFYIVPLLIGFILLKWKGRFRYIAVLLILFSLLSIIDWNPFRSSPFSPYHGDQGMAPFQEVIRYVNERGGLSFWNYPEQRSGKRKYGPIHVDTPPYPEVIKDSYGYTGFAAIYGDWFSITDPGREWDTVLDDYCRNKRKRPPWGISAADFHEDSRHGQKLGSFPTVFLTGTLSKEGVLEAMKNGRMYCSRGNADIWPKLDYFHIYGDGDQKAFMGETLKTSRYPIIRFRVSYNNHQKAKMAVHLIRGGTLLQTFSSETPMEVAYVDKEIPRGKKTFYRLLDAKKNLASNPIFVEYHPPDSEPPR
ncbi:MAG: hypothetical protein JRJ85_20990 [Deltaproteobacteria bacterium]|nr:hypothetical protein [Deltaproteobacteria bacterium]